MNLCKNVNCNRPALRLNRCEQHWRYTYNKEYRKKNREVLLTKSKEYYQTNKEKLQNYSKKYIKANKKRISNRDKIYNRTPKGRYNRALKSAQWRGVAWDLSFAAFALVILNQCHYCTENLPETGAGLDRKDNSLGYSSNNVVPCCTRCNDMKGQHITYEEMVFIWKRRLK